VRRPEYQTERTPLDNAINSNAVAEKNATQEKNPSQLVTPHVSAKETPVVRDRDDRATSPASPMARVSLSSQEAKTEEMDFFAPPVEGRTLEVVILPANHGARVLEPTPPEPLPPIAEQAAEAVAVAPRPAPEERVSLATTHPRRPIPAVGRSGTTEELPVLVQPEPASSDAATPQQIIVPQIDLAQLGRLIDMGDKTFMDRGDDDADVKPPRLPVYSGPLRIATDRGTPRREDVSSIRATTSSAARGGRESEKDERLKLAAGIAVGAAAVAVCAAIVFAATGGFSSKTQAAGAPTAVTSEGARIPASTNTHAQPGSPVVDAASAPIASTSSSTAASQSPAAASARATAAPAVRAPASSTPRRWAPPPDELDLLLDRPTPRPTSSARTSPTPTSAQSSAPKKRDILDLLERERL
jgi:hypothetical protein